MRAKSFIPLVVLFCGLTAAAQSGNLRVGAAKIDVTPSPDRVKDLVNVWGTPYQGIHDHIFARAIVIDNGTTSAAVVAIDSPDVIDTLPVRQRIEKESGIPAGNIFISTTHTHNAPHVGTQQNGRSFGPGAAKYTEDAMNAFADAVRKAKANLQPGKMILAQGHADLNVNRDEFVGDRWKTGRNPTRPSDKTVWVLRFDTAAGEPIAYYVNYGVHALTLVPTTLSSLAISPVPRRDLSSPITTTRLLPCGPPVLLVTRT